MKTHPAAAVPLARLAGEALLLRAGMFLFTLGLLSGLVVPFAANPRMALTSHLEGVLNGMFLLLLGLLWPRLQLGVRSRRLLSVAALLGTYTNWGITLLAAFWNAGSAMPIAAQGARGTDVQELLIAVALGTLSLAMLLVCALALRGLFRRTERVCAPEPIAAK